MPLTDVMRARHGRASKHVMGIPVQRRAVHRTKNRVRCAWLRCDARIARCDRLNSRRAWRGWGPFAARTRSGDQVCVPDTMWHRAGRTVSGSPRDRWRGCVRVRANTGIVIPTCDARGAREPRDGLVADGRTHRRCSPDRDAGPSLCPRDIRFRNSPARVCAFSLHSFDTPDEVLLIARRRPALRDPRRWRSRLRIHPVRPGRVPSGARPESGGAPV